MFIKSKWIKYYAKRTIKFTSLFAVGLIIMASIIYIKYKPSYKVTLNGQTIGYVQDKEEMQRMIEDLKNNPGENVADIKFNSLPSYQLEFLSGDLPDDTDKVLAALQNNSTVTYRAYAILLNGKKKVTVASEAEAKEVINTLSKSDRKNAKISEVCIEKNKAEEDIKSAKVAKTTLKKAVESSKKTAKKSTKKTTKKTTSRSSSSRSSSKKTSSSSSVKSVGGYAFPVKGCSLSNIRNRSYPSYAGHTGIDINIGVKGKSVVAAKDGVVIVSEALRSSSGAYKSYGEYIMIKHSNGTVTLYGHLKAGSRKVKVGQKVSKGQVIGTVGSTGNSTGTHLHFEVRVNGNPVNPYRYL